MKLWIKNKYDKTTSFPKDSDNMWYRKGEYLPVPSMYHAEYILYYYKNLGLNDGWKNNLKKKYNISNWKSLGCNEDGEFVLDMYHSDMESEMIEDVLSLGWLRIAQANGDFYIDCKSVKLCSNDLKKVLTDSYFQGSVVIYDYDNDFTITGNSDEVIDTLEGKQSNARIRIWNKDSKQYDYYTTLREVLR